MTLNQKSNSRRDFFRKCTALLVVSGNEITGLNGKSFLFRDKITSSKRIEILEIELVFVSDQPGDRSFRPVPRDFIHSQFPPIPEVPETIPVEYSWKTETCALFKERSLNGFGAINDGIYAEGEHLLQIVATTPGAPDTQAGSPLYKCWYRISADAGKTFSPFRLIMQAGNSKDEPVKGVKIGRNGYTIPLTSAFIKSSNGEIMVPVHLHPWDSEKQTIYNPANAYLFGDSGVLIGKWINNKQDIRWEFGEWARIDHKLSTRGLFEPSIAELSPGRFAMIMRGSNYTNSNLPGYSWISYSTDYCRTWSAPKPFTYADGSNFYTPASCSTLFRSVHNGILYWVGNITGKNPNGNHPRHPLVIGRVDEKNFGLIKDTVVTIDQRHPEKENERVELSNYKIMEHSRSAEIVIALTRRVDGVWAHAPSWYRIKLA